VQGAAQPAFCLGHALAVRAASLARLYVTLQHGPLFLRQTRVGLLADQALRVLVGDLHHTI
jgi:hypothetical protein